MGLVSGDRGSQIGLRGQGELKVVASSGSAKKL